MRRRSVSLERSALGRIGCGLSALALLSPPLAHANEAEPVRVGAHLQSSLVANPVGGSSQAASWINGLWLQIDLGSGLNRPQQQWREKDHWRLKLEAAGARGNLHYSEQIGTSFPLQSLTATGQWISELSVRREPGDGAIGLKAGLFALNPGQMESEVMNAYVHSAINDTFNNNVPGLPIAPFSSPGLQLSLKQPAGQGSQLWTLGAFAITPSTSFGQYITASGPPAESSGSVGLLQWQRRWSPASNAGRRPASRPAAAVPDLLPDPGLMLGGYWSQTTPQGRNRGLYGSTTLDLPKRLRAGRSSRLWIASQLGLDWQNNPAPVFWGAGLLMQGLLPSRPLDISGIGGASTGFSPTLNPGQSQESVLELNHQLQLSAGLSLKPFAQLILTPGGRSTVAAIVAAGLQASLQF